MLELFPALCVRNLDVLHTLLPTTVWALSYRDPLPSQRYDCWPDTPLTTNDAAWEEVIPKVSELYSLHLV